jgi:hypothetical protein
VVKEQSPDALIDQRLRGEVDDNVRRLITVVDVSSQGTSLYQAGRTVRSVVKCPLETEHAL